MIIPKSHKVELRAPTRLASFVAAALTPACVGMQGLWAWGTLGQGLSQPPRTHQEETWDRSGKLYRWVEESSHPFEINRYRMSQDLQTSFQQRKWHASNVWSVTNWHVAGKRHWMPVVIKTVICYGQHLHRSANHKAVLARQAHCMSFESITHMQDVPKNMIPSLREIS